MLPVLLSRQIDACPPCDECPGPSPAPLPQHIPAWKLALGAVYQVLRRVPLVGSALPPKPFPPVEDFQDFEDVLDLYGKVTGAHARTRGGGRWTSTAW